MDSLKFLQFHPSDEELITHYLCRKMSDNSFSVPAICEADLRMLDPWDFPGVSVSCKRRKWFFFSPRSSIYAIIYRATYSGYWKTTGKDIQIFKGKTLVGMKKSMVFYKGIIDNITKTNWLMHEYRLLERNNEWVICKVFLENKMEIISGITQAITAPQLEDTTTIKLKYKEDIVKFVLNNPTMDGLKTQVLKRFNKLESDALKFKYRDADGEIISIICDEDLQCCLQSFKSFGRIEVTMSLAS